MLDADTKRRIDTARDILVGKVPDPKSQIEQITIALIYKFMDDLDTQSEELGGAKKFFVGQFTKYSWSKLTQPGISGYDMLNLYTEAITRMPENPGIPPLFRKIFSNAFLPYHDPETLRAFLKVVDEFTYDDSEKLGDAFEYLLSVLGAQGDAGQFRTPRHIINFIVAIINPKKTERVLDPACGTAGFLISAYKHILAANTSKEGRNMLTPDAKTQLASNFTGYDISPDMVRLSLVNMYLHGFRDPHIYEYDTLASETHWNEHADVILTNPPFMSPRGGILPHNRFSVKSTRSEVLFVDYIAEHLTTSGRAGIIVPEGIVFQNQNAYRQLRKILVEDYLVAVVSLPAGVFNPYTGIKTSVLILDRALAKHAGFIALFKVEDDGFELGAQRRPIERNDLPRIQTDLRKFLHHLSTNKSLDSFQTAVGVVIKKEKIAASGEYNLNWMQYMTKVAPSSIFPFVKLQEIAQVAAGSSAPQDKTYFNSGKFPFVRTSDVGLVHRSDHFTGSTDRINQKAVNELNLKQFPTGTILLPKSGASIFLNHRVRLGEPAYVSSHLAGIICDENKAHSKYVYQLLCQIDARGITPDQAYPSLRLAEIGSIQIPLPPLETQQKIVAEVGRYQKIVDGARIVVENYRPDIVVDPKWPTIALGDVCKRMQYGLSSKLNTHHAGYKTFRMSDLFEGRAVDNDDMKFADIPPKIFKKYQLIHEDILFNRTNSIEHVGRTGIFNLDGPYCFASYLIRLSIDRKMANPFYINAVMNTNSFQLGIKQYASRAIGQSNINAKSLATYPIPFPPLTTQNRIVTELKAERALVESNKKIIQLFDQKIKTAISKIWRR